MTRDQLTQYKFLGKIIDSLNDHFPGMIITAIDKEGSVYTASSITDKATMISVMEETIRHISLGHVTEVDDNRVLN